MIAWLSGAIRERDAGRVVMDVAGVGYLLRVPMSTFLELPQEGARAELLVSTQVREDAITLYGFRTPEERDLFERLLTVAGVGPRIALAALSALGPEELTRSLVEEDARRLSTVPGIGKKTAERIVIDLADKVRALPRRTGGASAPSDEVADVVSALVNLGYNDRLAARAAQEAREAGRSGFAHVLKDALARLGKG